LAVAALADFAFGAVVDDAPVDTVEAAAGAGVVLEAEVPDAVVSVAANAALDPASSHALRTIRLSG